MKLLIVTEKFNPDPSKRDGGTRLVDTLKRSFQDSLSIMQFGSYPNSLEKAKWKFDYPVQLENRFKQRLANAEFIATKVKMVEKNFTHIAFIHISMQFGFTGDLKLVPGVEIWTFPMFLTPSYQESGEIVPKEYTRMEFLTLASTRHIITPSYLEKKQLVEFYCVPERKIHVIPRGIDTRYIRPQTRLSTSSPIFCSVGSIKPQKNTLGLVNLFCKIKKTFPGARLYIVGPVQNQAYYRIVRDEIIRKRLSDSIIFRGYVLPSHLTLALQGCHIHLSTATCETFGRAIFETLACGVPNVAMLKNNAAADFLSAVPYAKFVNNTDEVLEEIKTILPNLSKLSRMSTEVGDLYNDKLLGKLIVATICNDQAIVISDFDGTLFHKHDSEKTKQSMLEFQQFPKKIICSARSTQDLLQEIAYYNLQVDWIISYSGAVISDNQGNVIFITPIDQADIQILEKIAPTAQKIKVQNQVVQISMPATSIPKNIFNLNIEIYQDTAFISNWQSSKLRAIHRLLNHINWVGKVAAFGDGRYDREFLTYFDGKLVTTNSQISNQYYNDVRG